MTVHEQLSRTLELIRLERQADLDQYRQKVLLRSLTQRTMEGTTWYPLKLRERYVGTGERLIVEIDRTNHLDQPHSFQSGKVVSLFSNASGTPGKDHINGVVNYVRDNSMVITLNGDELPEWIDDSLLGVDVMFDEMSYREMEFALKEVIRADGRLGELRDKLLGDGKLTLRERKQEIPSAGLNDVQQSAVAQILLSNDLAIIHGPPGTGKTTTLVECITLIAREEAQVLVCAPSNAAIDLLVDKLDGKGLRVVRIGHPARVTEQSLSKTLDVQITQHENYPELKNLRKKMEQIKSQAVKYKRNFGHHEREQRRMLMQEAKVMKSDADMLEFYIVNDLIQKSDAICSTLVGSSHPTLRGRKFKTVFIDEAAQALEPACWIPLLKSSRVIFAGDHQQLPPTVKSAEAAKQGLAKTLFEKAIARHPGGATMLEVQYRMHQDIMSFPSAYFYDNKLKAHKSVKSALLRPNQTPVEFIDTAGCGYTEAQDPETLSRFNAQEAHLLIHKVEQLIGEVGVEEWLHDGITMGIITPYRAQVEHLHKLAEASEMLSQFYRLITINTVDAFQGQERDVIVISFVRSNEATEVGFLGDIRRTNVAMTRARKKLILIGDSATLGSHAFYLKMLDYIQEKGFYKSAFGII